ncbi:MAG: DNA alkylation repair protein [Paenisporosarcina sp.]
MKNDWNRSTYIEGFLKRRNEQDAKPMEAYMKHKFPFLGIKSPIRTEIMKDFFSNFHLPKDEVLFEETWSIYTLPQREFQYAAIALLSKKMKYLTIEDLPFIEKMIIEKAWWDSVDSIAPIIVGEIVKKDRLNGELIMQKWSNSDNMWLIRSAILHQLKYKTVTNEKMLLEIMLKHADSNEFFIQKAIGWVLREYAKTNPEFVKQFVQSHELKPLSKREALKHFK